MKKPSANVVAHSMSPNGSELITMEIELHRFILPEFNTHRCFSRNFQSSRAIPVEKMLEQVRNEPAMPVHWGKNQRGMVAEEELSEQDIQDGEQIWKLAATEMQTLAASLVALGVHKQIVNRLLEPFMWTKGVVTATRKGFESFFKLRSHKDAQPEIKALSDAMREAVESSLPKKLEYGEYHLPYVTCSQDSLGIYFPQSNITNVKEAIKVSTSCCAQVSYRVLDNSLEKALKIYDMLNLPENGVYGDDPPHFSPTEHVARVAPYTNSGRNGNFHNSEFWQYRKALEIGKESLFEENSI